MAPEVTIVVLLTCSHEAERCLRAIAAAREPDPASELVLVISGDDPALAAVVTELAAGAQVLSSVDNCGTAVAWNVGFEHARGAHVAILHEDAEPQPGWLGAALATMCEHPEAAIVGSRQFEPGGRVDGGWLVWDDGYTIGLDERSAPALIERSVAYPVDYCPGSAMLVERALWEEAGGFDERYYPAMYVDVDICTAAWQLGRAVLHEPGSHVLHRMAPKVGGRRGVFSSREYRRFLYWRQRGRYLEKWAAALPDHARRPAGVPPDGATSADVERAALRPRHGCTSAEAAECRR